MICLKDVAETCLETIANIKCKNNNTFIDPKFHEQLVQFHRKQSSISAISYYAVSEQTEKRDKDIQEYENTKIEENIKEEQHSPSATHTDTGILTMILNSDVPGLQVKPNNSQEFVEVEKINNPWTDMYLILGRKLEFFAKEEKLFTPTVHRVIIPKNQKRYSLIYFCDVPM